MHVPLGRIVIFDHRTMASLVGLTMHCAWCDRPGMVQGAIHHRRNIPELQGLWIIGSRNYIVAICNKCGDHGDPPHARFLQGLLREHVSRTPSELIAAYAYPVHAAGTYIPVTYDWLSVVTRRSVVGA